MLDTTGREVTIDRGGGDALVTQPPGDPAGWPVHTAEPIEVSPGDAIVLVCGGEARAGGPAVELAVSYAALAAMVEPGDCLFVGRYLATGAEETSLYLTVSDVSPEGRITATAGNGASLAGLLTVFHSERSPDGVANLQNDLPVLTAADKAALAALAGEFEVDYVSLSFTRCAEDVVAAREWMDTVPGLAATRVLAKVETRQALFNFGPIARAADGVILSRGNLGLDVLPEKMALVQKAVVAACARVGKPALLTRVVDTMVTAPRPTRAEATDVANAVLDGVDAILLGAETLRGRHPAATVATVLAICRQAESVFDANAHFERLMRESVAAEDDAAARAAAASSSAALDRAGSVDDVHILASQARLGGGAGGGAFAKAAAASAGRAANGGENADASLPGASASAMSLGRSMVSGGGAGPAGAPVLSKLESMASSAVRAAEKVGAALIVVYTQSGAAASLVSKYRPPIPIVALVIPRLASDGMAWRLEGRAVARQALIQRGLLPVLAAPAPSGEALLEEAVSMAAAHRLVGAGDHVVILQMVRDAFAIKIVTMDESGRAIAAIRPRSLMDLVRHTAGGFGGGTEDGEVSMGDDGCGYAGAAVGGATPHLAFGAVTGMPSAATTTVVARAVLGGQVLKCASDAARTPTAAG